MPLLDMICSMDPATRNRSLAAVCQGLSFDDLLSERESLDRFRRESNNLYRSRPRPVLPLRHQPLPPAGAARIASAGRIPYGVSNGFSRDVSTRPRGSSKPRR